MACEMGADPQCVVVHSPAQLIAVHFLLEYTSSSYCTLLSFCHMIDTYFLFRNSYLEDLVKSVSAQSGPGVN